MDNIKDSLSKHYTDTGNRLTGVTPSTVTNKEIEVYTKSNFFPDAFRSKVSFEGHVDRFNVTQFDTVNNPKDITGTKNQNYNRSLNGKITSASVINGGSGHKKNDKFIY